MAVAFREEIVIDKINYLTGYIDQHYGYDFSKYSVSSFIRRLNRIMDKFSFTNIEELIQHLQAYPSFIKIFLHEITVHVSEMFRDPEFWQYSKDNYLKTLFKQPREKITFWLAGCAGGEEVFSLAILLKENGWYDRAEIIATDIDELIFPNAISGKVPLKLMQSTYTDNYIKSGGINQLTDYYTIEQDTAIMDLALLKNVTFQKHDLVKGSALGIFDVVFCRNVMIYFNPLLQNQVYHLLTESLANSGILAIGSKESMIWSNVNNHFTIINKEKKIHRKI